MIGELKKNIRLFLKLYRNYPFVIAKNSIEIRVFYFDFTDILCGVASIFKFGIGVHFNEFLHDKDIQAERTEKEAGWSV